MTNMNKQYNRRNFIKYLSGAAVASSAMLSACKKAMSGESSGIDEEASDGSMTYRINPNTNDRVSLLGYGMMRLPELPKPEDAPDHQPAEFDQEMINQQVDYALEHGVNYFDTSPAYCRGLSERCTGIALSRHDRKSYYIATKMSNFWPGSWTTEASKEMFEKSLRELQVDYIDYLLLHAIGGSSRDADGNQLSSWETFEARYMNNGILDWLVEQKQAGRIRNLGFSYHGDVKVFDQLLQWHDEGRYHWDFVQIELNYLDWFYADEINPSNTDAVYLYGELEKRGIPAVIMEPLLGGRLARVTDEIAAKLKQRDPDHSIATWAFRFAGTPQGVLTVLSGMTFMEHLVENVATYSPLHPISDDEHEFLMQIAEEIFGMKTVPCNECQYCMPCPYGVNIPAIFSHYNKCIRDGYIKQSNLDPAYRTARRAFLIGYDRAVPRLRQADHCIGCGQCATHCPQQIDIPGELHRIDEYVEELKRAGGPL
ncbi:MAG: aldo/keto reductase [Bacteroidaceae bacterium]|nr:aldo/keto reductase [Bacteroidaceae bacterium]